MKRQCTFILGAAALALAAPGCSNEPDLYLGGPAGPPAALQLSDSRVDLAAGANVTIGARVVDAAGNWVAGVTPAVSAANAAIANATAGAANEYWAVTATVTGVALGEAVVTVSAAGLSQDVTVRVGPASVTLVGPVSVPSGESVDYEAKFWDLGGNELTMPADFPAPVLTSTNTSRIAVTRTGPLTWTASAAAPGTLALQVATDTKEPRYGAIVTSSTGVTVVPGTFSGTISATSGEPLDTIVLKAAAGRDWDGDEYVTLGTQVGINWTGRAADAQFTGTADTLVFLVPVNLAPGDYTLTLFRQGTAQIAEIAGTFTVVARSTPYTAWVNPSFTPSTDGARIDGKVLPLAFPTVLVEGDEVDSFYTIRSGATPVARRAVTSWIDPAGAFDVDQGWVNAAFTVYTSTAGLTGANPEIVTRTVPANTMEFFWIQLYEGPAGATIAVQNTINVP